MAETVQAIADDIFEKIKTVKVNTDKEEAIVTQQRISTIPAFQVMNNGKPADLIRGPLSKLDLMAKLSSFITEDGGPAPSEPSPAAGQGHPGENAPADADLTQQESES